MKTMLFLFVASSLVGCGQNPVGPSPPQVKLSMLVMGSTIQVPIHGASVILVDDAGRGDARRTDVDGLATWLVVPGRYTVSVCGRSGPFALVTQDAGWLTSLPEELCR